MRPRYESSRDRREERGIVQAFCMRYGLTATRQEDRKRVNYFCHKDDGTLELILEIKRRYIPKDAYPTVMISQAKWVAGCRLSQRYGVAYAIIVKWEDHIGLISNRIAYPDYIEEGGRTDRGDPRDIEPMCHFRTSRFVEILDG